LYIGCCAETEINKHNLLLQHSHLAEFRNTLVDFRSHVEMMMRHHFDRVETQLAAVEHLAAVEQLAAVLCCCIGVTITFVVHFLVE
jgi:hypothetical protein